MAADIEKTLCLEIFFKKPQHMWTCAQAQAGIAQAHASSNFFSCGNFELKLADSQFSR